MEIQIKDGVEAVPAGSLSLGEENSRQDGGNEQEEQQTQEGQPQEQLILGKFKSADDLATAYQALEKDHGRLGTEVGSLRTQADVQTKQTELLLNQLQQLSRAQQAQGPGAEPDFDAALAALTEKVEAGDIDIATALKQTALLTAQQAAGIADQKVRQVAAEREAKAIQSNFVKANPDFLELRKSGQLEALKAENPMHDDFSAYFAYKQRQTLSDVDAKVKAAMEAGRQEGAKLAAGAEAAGRVLGKTGASPRQQTGATQPKNDGEMTAGMLGILQGMRGGGG